MRDEVTVQTLQLFHRSLKSPNLAPTRLNTPTKFKVIAGMGGEIWQRTRAVRRHEGNPTRSRKSPREHRVTHRDRWPFPMMMGTMGIDGKVEPRSVRGAERRVAALLPRR